MSDGEKFAYDLALHSSALKPKYIAVPSVNAKRSLPTTRNTSKVPAPAPNGVTNGLVSARMLTPKEVFAMRNSGTPIPGSKNTKTDYISSIVGFYPQQLGMVTSVQIAGNLDTVQPYVLKSAASHKLSPELINGIIVRESKGLQNAVSPSGALGISQETYGIYGSNQAAKVFGSTINPFDAQAAIDRQATLLSQLSKKYDGNVDKILAAYNQGEPIVNTAINTYGENWLNNIPAEGQTYVSSIRNIMSGTQTIPGYFGTRR